MAGSSFAADAAVDLSGAEWNAYANLHGHRQAMRIEREREIVHDLARPAF